MDLSLQLQNIMKNLEIQNKYKCIYRIFIKHPQYTTFFFFLTKMAESTLILLHSKKAINSYLAPSVNTAGYKR